MQGEELAESLRHFGDLEDQAPLVAILDIPQQQVYVHPEKEITKDGLHSLVNDFKECKLEYKPLER